MLDSVYPDGEAVSDSRAARVPPPTQEVQGHLIDPASIPDDPFACPSRLAVKRYKFTTADCRKGGKAAAARPEFPGIQQKGIKTFIERYGEDALHIVCRHAKKRRARSQGASQ